MLHAMGHYLCKLFSYKWGKNDKDIAQQFVKMPVYVVSTNKVLIHADLS